MEKKDYVNNNLVRGCNTDASGSNPLKDSKNNGKSLNSGTSYTSIIGKNKNNVSNPTTTGNLNGENCDCPGTNSNNNCDSSNTQNNTTVIDSNNSSCSNPQNNTSKSGVPSNTTSLVSFGNSNLDTRESYIRKATFLAARNRLQESLAVYNLALQKYPNDSDLLNCKGVCLRNLNKPNDAMECYNKALIADPNNASACNNKGVIYKERDEYDKAIQCYLNALRLDPLHKTATTNLAIVLTDLGTKLKSEGCHKEALEKYHEAIRSDPTYSPCFYNLGVIHSEMGDYHRAIGMYNEAIKLNPRYVEAYNNLGAICKNLGQLHQAILFYERALQLNPNFEMSKGNIAVALTDLGTQVKTQGDIKEGIRLYKKALIYNPHYADAYYNLGVAYGEQFKYGKALVYYQLAISFNPRCAEAYNNLGVIYKDRENLDKAIYYYTKALEINPNFSQTLNNIGVIYTVVGRMTEAHEYTRRAIEANPHYAEAYNNMGVLYRDQGEVPLAIQAYEKCIAIDPNSRNASQNRLLAFNYVEEMSVQAIYKASLDWGNRFIGMRKPYTSWLCDYQNFFVTKQYTNKVSSMNQGCEQTKKLSFMGKIRNGIGKYAQFEDNCVIDSDDEDDDTLTLDVCSNMGNSRNIVGDNNVQNLDKSIGSVMTDQCHKKNYICEIDCRSVTLFPNRQLRVGYIGPDFFTHSVSYFIHGPLACHDPMRVNVIVYSNVVKEDEKTQMFKTLSRGWRNIANVSDVEVARRIYEDKIDVLVELTGHTANNRLDVMAYKPAPVQVTWIGYPNTTGLWTVDYRLTDYIVDPVDTKQQFVEKLYRLPDCFLCYTPHDDLPDIVSKPPAVENGFVTFGSFNNVAKIGPQVIKLWSQVLLKVPDSRLLIKAKPFVNSTIQKRFVSQFEEHGVSADRLDLMGLIPICADHLKTYGLMDIALDTFPYSGTTTTCESLLMGVPIVVLKGSDNHAHNVGVSLLKNIGLHELIAETPAEFVQIACDLANDCDRLCHYRETIRSRMLNSTLTDAERLTKNVENAYIDMYNTYCESQKKKSGVIMNATTKNLDKYNIPERSDSNMIDKSKLPLDYSSIDTTEILQRNMKDMVTLRHGEVCSSDVMNYGVDDDTISKNQNHESSLMRKKKTKGVDDEFIPNAVSGENSYGNDNNLKSPKSRYEAQQRFTENKGCGSEKNNNFNNLSPSNNGNMPLINSSGLCNNKAFGGNVKKREDSSYNNNSVNNGLLSYGNMFMVNKMNDHQNKNIITDINNIIKNISCGGNNYNKYLYDLKNCRNEVNPIKKDNESNVDSNREE